MPTETDTRQRILSSARELIYASSYAEAGVAAICARAEVKKGSFYHFFPSKQALTLAVIDQVFEEMRAQLFDPVLGGSGSPFERLAGLMERLYAHQREVAERSGQVKGCPFGNLAAELSSQEEPIRDRIRRVFANMERAFAAILEEAIGANELTADELDVATTARAMVAYLEGVMLLAKTRNDPDVIKHLAPGLLSIRVTIAA